MSSAALAELAAAERVPSAVGGAATTPQERFSLLLLEDGEYYFRSHTAYFWPPDNKRQLGSLKFCSRSFFFVPRDVQQPIFRVPFEATSAIGAVEEAGPHGEDQFEAAASTRVDMRAGGVDAPYAHHQGDYRFRFSLVYASLEDVLPLVEELLLLAHAATATGGSRAARAEAAQKLAQIIQEHEEAERFNPGWLEEEESVVAEAPASAVTPLAAQPGRAVLTQHRLYFQPFNASVCAAPLQAYALSKVVAVAARVYQLEGLGLEVFFSSRHSLYLAFRSPADRDAFQAALMQQPALQLERMRSREQWTRDWVNGRISNFDYLMHLNREAGRSFKDLSQYPVMPWVVADYTSPTLDLSDPATYRDLSKPIGALNPHRLADFRQRYAELQQMMAPPDGGGSGGRGGKSSGKAGKNGGKGGPASKAAPPGAPPPLETPPFLYGCHYSSPGYVVFYLMRSDPQLMLRLQNGRFDAPDRLFWSIADTWKSVLSLPSDVKELVPEFYSNDPAFLLNRGGTDFGCRSGGQRVGDVALPPWAADARDFLYQLREALESPLVSARLHKWIDLVFGRKARGEAAVRADNVFHYLTYDEVALQWLASERDPAMRDALRLQMMEFGRTPRQLFTRKHPKRRVLGRGGMMACLGCFALPTAAAAPRPTNQLTGKPYDVRSIPPVSRAVFKLSCTPQHDKRQALLAFLEQAAAEGEPDALALRQTRGAELFLLVKAARDARAAGRVARSSGGGGRSEGAAAAAAAGTAEQMQETLVRAVAALAVCPQNRRHILEAGCLDPVAEALQAAQPAAATAAAQVGGPGYDGCSLERACSVGAGQEVCLPGSVCCQPRPSALCASLGSSRSTATCVMSLGWRMPALQALALLAREQSPRLQALDSRSLEALLGMLRQPPTPEALLAALSAVAYLSEAYPAHRTFFERRDLLGLLLQQLQSSAVSSAASSALADAAGAPSPTVRPDSRAGLLAGHRAESRAMRRRTTMVTRAAGTAADDAPNVQPSLVRRQHLQAVAVLLQDESQRDAFLAGSGALRALLEDCSSASLAVRSGAFECLAALTASDAMRQQVKDLRLLSLLLEGAGISAPQVQQPAAAAIANLCSDPALVVAELGSTPEGLAPVVALALAADEDVRRSAAAALWHLAVAPEARTLAIEAGALSALLSLAVQQRNVVARELARQALVRCCAEDEAQRAALEGMAAAKGLEAGEVAALLKPSSARSFASFAQRNVHHRKLHSDIPSSASGAISRTSSFRSAADASPFSNRAAQLGDMWSQASGSQTPGAAAAAAAANSGRSSSPGPELAGGGVAAAAAVASTAEEHAPARGAASVNGTANGEKALPPPLQVPHAPALPLPLPIITPVGGKPDSPLAAAKQQEGQQQQQQAPPQAIRLRSSAAAAEAAASSPKGVVAHRVQQLERTASGLGSDSDTQV
ncbi:hypothetical protein ABPG75_007795 [Micractinium tetrahymenae]